MVTSTPSSSESTQSAAPWLGVELRLLATLIAIGREGSFRRAADRLGYVPSAVSQQVAALERAVGERLVDRASGGGRVRLTASGRLLARHATGILGRLHAAQADLVVLSGDRGAELRIGVAYGFPGSVLSDMVREVVGAVANLHLRPVEAPTTGELCDLVREGALDVALGELPLEPGPFDHLELLVDPYVLALPAAGSTLSVPEMPTIDHIVALPLILSQCDSLSLDAATCRRLERAAVARTASPASAAALVPAGVGAAILGSLTPGVQEETMRTIDLTHIIPPRRIAVIWHRERRLVHTIEAFRNVAARLHRGATDVMARNRERVAA